MANKPYKPPIIPPKLPADFMKFDMGAQLPLLDQFIRHRGTPIKHTKHVICPCIEPTRQAFSGTGEPIPDCPECSGTGFAYPGKPEEVLGTVSGVGAQDTATPVGTMSTGQISVTFPTDVTVAEGDRLHLYRSIVPVRHLRKAVHKKGMALPFDVKDIRSLVTNNRHLKIIELVRGKDYTLDVEKNFLAFVDGGAIQIGMVISAVLMVSPYYIVQNLTSAFRGQLTRAFSKDGSEEWSKMPQGVIAIRSDILAGRFERDVANRGDPEKGEGW